MKYIKKYESNFNFNIEIFTISEASDFHQKFLEKNKKYRKINLKTKIHYFDYNDFSTMFASDSYKKSCRFIIAYNEKDILGICKFAYWDMSSNYAISYLSTNEDFFSKGISKKLLETTFKYFSETYPNETLSFSGYSIEGWKYLRKSILEFSKKYSVKITEKGIEYPGRSGKFSEEDWQLMSKSREEIKNTYGSDNSYY